MSEITRAIETINRLKDKKSRSGLADIIEEQGRQSDNKNIEFNDALPEPDAIYKTEYYEYGYFKVSIGVVRNQKFSNGYSQHTSMLFSNEERKAQAIKNGRIKTKKIPKRQIVNDINRDILGVILGMYFENRSGVV